MSTYYLGFWNLENLFGPEDYEDRIEWIKSDVKSDLEGWDDALFEKKLDQLTSIVIHMNGDTGPDILGVCEVEDEHILGKLVSKLNAARPARAYDIIYKTRDISFRGIDTAIIFDANAFSFDDELVFNHFVMRRTGTRDILQSTLKSKATGSEIVVMVNHWPSRYGGGSTAGFRATAAETLAYWHGRIFEEAPGGTRTPVVAIGDMNDDPWDDSMTVHALATRERGDVMRAKSPKFWNASWTYLETPAVDHKGNNRVLEGTLYYDNNGNVFDQVLLNRPLVDTGDASFKYVEDSVEVFAPAEMVSHLTGKGPIRFGLPEGDVEKNINEDGFSDHFPVGVKVRDTAA
ncbi:MAG: endonuclease [Pseudomonadota bacterium]